MIDVPQHDQLELVQPASTANKEHGACIHGTCIHSASKATWVPMEPPIPINYMHAFKALQRQPFHRAKRKLHPALTAVITRLHFRDGSQDGNHFLMSQSPVQLWEHGHMLTEYHVWVCYRAATHQLNLYFPGRESDSTCKRNLAGAKQNEGLLHIL